MKENKIQNRCYVVYKHTSPNNKVYIGITGQNPPEKRWANGRGYTQNEYFSNEIIQYGWNNFAHEILYNNLTRTEAQQKEIELIAHYKSTDKKFGYNISSGSVGIGNISEELRKKIRDSSNIKNAIPVIQYTLLGEFIRVFDSATIAGEETGVCSSNITKCCKEKLKSAGNYVWRYADHKLNLANYNYRMNKQVIQYTKDGIFICIYNSIIEASIKNDIDQSSITKCCKGKLQSVGGYIWRYTSDIENFINPLFASLSKVI